MFLSLTPTAGSCAFDWLGMGGSSRPRFPTLTPCTSAEEADLRVTEAELFFVDSMEAWRKSMQLEQFDLMGHSLGGYLSACYALRFPERVRTLTLVSPVGLPKIPPPYTGSDRLHPAMRALLHAWNWNVTPMKLVRALGPYGQTLVQRGIGRRFAPTFANGHLDADQTPALMAEYVYHITASAGSGEYAGNALLSPQLQASPAGFYARRPLADRLHQLHMPTTLVFGTNDWMMHRDIPGIVDADPRLQLSMVEGAGHHLYLDNPGRFLEVVSQSLRRGN